MQNEETKGQEQESRF